MTLLEQEVFYINYLSDANIGPFHSPISLPFKLSKYKSSITSALLLTCHMLRVPIPLTTLSHMQNLTQKER